jgi:hypothetical protein
MAFIEKELLISRVQYLEEVNSRPGKTPVDGSVTTKVKEMILAGELISFMQVEAVFNFLAEKTSENPAQIDSYASEILAFIS